MEIVLHSTHCPKCNVLKTKLEQKNIEFKENNDVKLMMQKGFTSAPMLEIDNIIYDFKEAVKWIGEQ